MNLLKITTLFGWFLMEILTTGSFTSRKPSFYDASFFPIKEGMQWEYRVTEDGQSDLQQVVCHILKDDNQHGTFFELQNSGTRNSCYRYRLHNDSIYHLDTRLSVSFLDYTFVNSPEFPVFCFPVKESSCWKKQSVIESPLFDKAVLASFAVLPEEYVTTPAGSWNCMKLQIDLQENSRHRVAIAYYASDIGLVKLVSPDYQKELIRVSR